jgi:hypothetical protein
VTDELPVKVGDIVKITEADYCFGLGDLRLRVTAVAPDRLGRPEPGWVYLTGFTVTWNGEEQDERNVLVRVKALHRPNAVRPT